MTTNLIQKVVTERPIVFVGSPEPPELPVGWEEFVTPPSPDELVLMDAEAELLVLDLVLAGILEQ